MRWRAVPRRASHYALTSTATGPHAAVQVDAKDRKRLEQLCRHITCPALFDEWAQLTAARQVELKLKTPWRDGSTHLAMSLMEFIQRLAALVLQPRLHLPMTASWPSISAIGCPVWVDCSSSSDSTERPLIDAQLPSTCERPEYVVDPSVITGNRAAVPDPFLPLDLPQRHHSEVSVILRPH